MQTKAKRFSMKDIARQSERVFVRDIWPQNGVLLRSPDLRDALESHYIKFFSHTHIYSATRCRNISDRSIKNKRYQSWIGVREQRRQMNY